MGLSLKIENMTSLPDGGPLRIDVPGKRGVDIGRDQHLDWTLPDPTRFISGKHCEVRFKDEAYWLHDVSSNGTFLNGSEDRMRSPHRLRTGDQLEIGDYIISVKVDVDEKAPAPARAAIAKAAPYEDLWQVGGAGPPPLAIEPLRAPRADGPVTMDFLDRLVETSGPVNDALWNDSARPARPVARQPSAELDWGGDFGLPAAPPPRRPAKLPNEAVDPFDYAPRQQAEVAPPAPSPAARDPAPPPPIVLDDKKEAIAPNGADAATADFVRLVARAAGVSEAVFASYAPAELAAELGLILRLTTLNLQQLLSARSELKDVVRSSNHTTIVKANNNPLKFSPDVEDAIKLMFVPSAGSYLNAPRAIEQSFNDLKQHQGMTFAAMQSAIGMIQRDLDPKSIEAEAEVERGLGSIVASRKAKFWDAYVARWRIGVARHENGLLGVFLDYFAASYDRPGGDRRSP